MRNTDRKSPGVRKAFTLIELMVVLLIIALLSSMLIPAINQARIAAKTAQSRVLINTLETAVHSFKSDEWLGGGYPPSFYTDCIHAPENDPYGNGSTFPIQGAQTLVWAVVGAELTGARRIELGMEAAYDDPALARGPFVDPSKLEIVRPEKCEFGLADPPQLAGIERPYPVIVDSFNMPVLYYLPDRNPQLDEIYDMLPIRDNRNFTRKSDFSNIAVDDDFTDFFIDRRAGEYGSKQPHNYDTFVLLSGGADKIYGTMDDPANFPLNPSTP